MCQRNFIDFKKACDCEPESEKKIPNKEESLAQLKEYKRNLEAELAMVKSKLKANSPAKRGEKGGE